MAKTTMKEASGLVDFEEYGDYAGPAMGLPPAASGGIPPQGGGQAEGAAPTSPSERGDSPLPLRGIPPQRGGQAEGGEFRGEIQMAAPLTRKQKELMDAQFEWQIPIKPEVQADGTFKYLFVNGPDVYGNRRTRDFTINYKTIRVPYKSAVYLDEDWAYHVYSCLKGERRSMDSSMSPGILLIEPDGSSRMVTSDSLKW
jgi:hypothetical protein